MNIGEPLEVIEVVEDEVPYEGEEVSPGEDLEVEVDVEEEVPA